MAASVVLSVTPSQVVNGPSHQEDLLNPLPPVFYSPRESDANPESASPKSVHSRSAFHAYLPSTKCTRSGRHDCALLMLTTAFPGTTTGSSRGIRYSSYSFCHSYYSFRVSFPFPRRSLSFARLVLFPSRLKCLVDQSVLLLTFFLFRPFSPC